MFERILNTNLCFYYYLKNIFRTSFYIFCYLFWCPNFNFKKFCKVVNSLKDLACQMRHHDHTSSIFQLVLGNNEFNRRFPEDSYG